MAFSKHENVYKETTTKEYIIALLVAVFTMIVVATVAVCARFMKKLDYAVIQSNNAMCGVIMVGAMIFFSSSS
jgi:hypothetical protein